jgi:hypothetical protein
LKQFAQSTNLRAHKRSQKGCKEQLQTNDNIEIDANIYISDGGQERTPHALKGYLKLQANNI